MAFYQTSLSNAYPLHNQEKLRSHLKYKIDRSHLGVKFQDDAIQNLV